MEDEPIKLTTMELNQLLLAIGEEPDPVEMEVGLTKHLTPKGWNDLLANAY